MPIYEYRCAGCEKQFELVQKFGDEPLTVCPDCGGPVSKLISNTSFVLKGTGWYVTDYARKKPAESGKETGAGSESKGGDSGSGPEAGKKTEEASKA